MVKRAIERAQVGWWIALMGLGRFGEARTEFRNALRLGVDRTVADEAQRALAQLDSSRRRR